MKYIKTAIYKIACNSSCLNLLITGIGFILVFNACGENGHSEMLDQVDEAVRNAPTAQTKALNHADSLSKIAANINNADYNNKYGALLNAAEAWQSLDEKLALKHIKEAIELAQKSGSDSDITKATIKLGTLYNSQGSMIKEASEIFKELSEKEMPDSLKIHYYILGVQLYRNLAERYFDSELKDFYVLKASSYRDSVLQNDPGSIIIAVNKLMEKKEYGKALSLLNENKPDKDPFDRSMAPYYHYLSEIYKNISLKDSQIYYLSMSSITDLNNGVKEYKALTELADIIKDTDPERAYYYISRSETDAQQSHSDLRQKEILPVYREIHALYNSRQKQKQIIATYILIGCALIFVIILISFISLRKKNKKLKLYTELLSNTKHEVENYNNKLKELNKELSQQSRIKEQYVRSFMELSLSYLAQMERFRADMAKIAAKKNWEQLAERINSSRYVNKEVQEFFDNFDKAFLSIYPDFIESLNTLLRKENQFTLSDGKLSTELRIYALIILGIEESNQIAKFLRCSESTIYNYRTRMRNRAIDRENFENQIKDIKLL